MTQYAIDANGNGIMDADEVVNDSSNTVMTFNSNGMGNLTDFSGYSSPFKWAAESNNWLKITDDTLGTSYYLHIDQLTASTLVFKDTLSGGVAEWTIFAKQ